MASCREEEKLERRMAGAIAVSLVLNAAGLWALARTSPWRQPTSPPAEIPLTGISVGAPLPRRRGLLPSPASSPTPPPSVRQARLASAAGRLPTPALPPDAYPGVVPVPMTEPPPLPTSSPTPVPSPTPGRKQPEIGGRSAAYRRRSPIAGVVAPDRLPKGFKPVVLPPPGAGGQPVSEQTGFYDRPPTPTPSARPATPAPEATPEPSPSPTPKPETPRGESRDAEPLEKSPPEIPEGLKYRPQVKLSIDVDEKGAADYTILTSTGNSEVDEYVLEALRKWKWRPALRGGKPTATSFAYTWNFQGEVHHSACTHPIGWV